MCTACLAAWRAGGGCGGIGLRELSLAALACGCWVWRHCQQLPVRATQNGGRGSCDFDDDDGVGHDGLATGCRSGYGVTAFVASAHVAFALTTL